MSLQALDGAKKCDGKKMSGPKDQSSGKNAFHIISFFCPSIFSPSLKMECQLKGELNPKRLLEVCSLLFIAAIETQAAFCEEFPPWTAAACCRFGSGSLLPNEEFVNLLSSERFSTAGCGSESYSRL
jgi:hypothetical protein